MPPNAFHPAVNGKAREYTSKGSAGRPGRPHRRKPLESRL
jgi:hypothetical protein